MFCFEKLFCNYCALPKPISHRCSYATFPGISTTAGEMGDEWDRLFEVDDQSSDSESAPLLKKSTPAAKKSQTVRTPRTPKTERVLNVEATFLRSKSGSSQLVDPEGYEYIRNRVCANESIYWVCKTHHRWGCRANALTKGFILTKLGGFHKHEDKKAVFANKKLAKRKSKLAEMTKSAAELKDESPAKRSSVGNHSTDDVKVLNIDATFVIGKKSGKAQLQDPSGYLYTKANSSGDVSYWVCLRKGNGCKARAITRGTILEKLIHFHTGHDVIQPHGNSGRYRDHEGSWCKDGEKIVVKPRIKPADDVA